MLLCYIKEAKTYNYLIKAKLKQLYYRFRHLFVYVGPPITRSTVTYSWNAICVGR
jgi:hypothetical protein